MLRYKAFELLDGGARDAATARVRAAVADPDGAADTAVALTLLLRATCMLPRIVGTPPSRRIERALEERRQELPPVPAAVLAALDARRRRLDAIAA